MDRTMKCGRLSVELKVDGWILSIQGWWLVGNKNKTALQFRLKRETVLIVCIFIIAARMEDNCSKNPKNKGSPSIARHSPQVPCRLRLLSNPHSSALLKAKKRFFDSIQGKRLK